jgi:uncharacterized protein YndB with AHSA1/START domain
MKKITTSITLIFVSVLLLNVTDAKAQMAAAKMIPPKYKNKIELNASVNDVWNLVSQPARYAEWVLGVKKFECHGKTRGAKMNLELISGEKRSQEVSVLNKDEKLITYFVKESTYLDQAWVYRFLVKKKKGKAVLHYEVYFGTSDAKVKKGLMPKLKGEWKNISTGIKSQF